MAGTVEQIWRFPVKSFKGEQLSQAEFTTNGILGDRGYALVDKETGKVVSAKSVRLFPDVLMCGATYHHPPKVGQDLPPVQITLADGTKLVSDDDTADQVLSNFFGRSVTLAKTAPEDFTIDMHYPDVEHLNPAGQRDTFVEQKLGSALFKEMGVDSPLPPESFMDVFPLSLITTSTLERLQELEPDVTFDLRRFRMNVVINSDQSGFVENAWVGKAIALGDNIQVVATMPDARCVMTTLAQDGIPADNNVLRSLVQHNRLDIMGSGKYPCAGVYAVIKTTGSVRVGEPVALH